MLKVSSITTSKIVKIEATFLTTGDHTNKSIFPPDPKLVNSIEPFGAKLHSSASFPGGIKWKEYLSCTRNTHGNSCERKEYMKSPVCLYSMEIRNQSQNEYWDPIMYYMECSNATSSAMVCAQSSSTILPLFFFPILMMTPFPVSKHHPILGI